MKKACIFFFLTLITLLGFSQNSERVFKNALFDNGEVLTVEVNDGRYLIKFYTLEIVETTFIPTGQEIKKESHAVILKPAHLDIDVTETKKNVFFSSEGLQVVIDKLPFQISYFYNEVEIISEKKGYSKETDFEKIEFNITPDEVLYGGGARALGMNRRGNRLQLYNKAHYGYEVRSELMNFTLPIVVSSKRYLIHFDNAPIGYLDLDSKKDNSLSYETISGRKTYQIIVGNSWLNLIDNYTHLTGKQPLPPRWVFGNFSSRFGYHSQKETEETIAKFKEEEIPVDAIILDLYWFGKEVKGTMGNLQVDKDSFPDMKGMISRLKDKGVKTVLITEPFVLTTSKRWEEAVDKEVLAKDSLGNPFTYDFYFGNTGLIDIYHPKGGAWFWNIYKDLIHLGVKGLWGDLGEPEVHPSNLIHATGTADEVHNIYGHDWARIIFEGYQRDFSNERPFILMRAGYSGSQRFGMIPWSGDVSRSWGGLQSQPEIALQMGMQGLAYMHSDLGGFAGDNVDDSLYTRWLQYGVFQPIFRPHAQEEVPSEPVYRSEKAKALAKKAIELRYKLLPYNYHLAFENNQKGTPFMRPLFFEEPMNKQLATSSKSYLWGNDFLITPILKDSIKTKEIYFPKENVWFDFYTDKRVAGNQTKKINVTAKSIPTFVRAGAFIPMAKLVQTTDNYHARVLEIHYYFDQTIKESRQKLYNDDGLTANAFEKGKFEILEFEAQQTNRFLKINFDATLGENWIATTKDITLVIHNIDWKPKKIKVNRKRQKGATENNLLRILVKWDPHKELKIRIATE
jgi:alpha-glucosidase (family GH31 glycosyl hydrolase)